MMSDMSSDFMKKMDHYISLSNGRLNPLSSSNLSRDIMLGCEDVLGMDDILLGAPRPLRILPFEL